ncbi:hypothetical protein VE00_09430 [Pseudogymnoascus sp. WSF 3629]|nr:hypothetical protein VE00_09430 [Pseudogymnoascus sp. WSF 3629]
MSTPFPGGFLPPPLPSPSPSTVSSPHTSTTLPHPRPRPLRPGSGREETTRRWVENALLKVSRRYVKKFQPVEMRGDGEGRGYERMGDVCRDLGEVVDVLWRSGTPSLQIPYLFNIALAVSTYLPSFPAAPGATFGLLRKMDHALASLLVGKDVASGETLPGLEEEGSGMSRTDMVRSKVYENTIVRLDEALNRGTAYDVGASSG